MIYVLNSKTSRIGVALLTTIKDSVKKVIYLTDSLESLRTFNLAWLNVKNINAFFSFFKDKIWCKCACHTSTMWFQERVEKCAILILVIIEKELC